MRIWWTLSAAMLTLWVSASDFEANVGLAKNAPTPLPNFIQLQLKKAAQEGRPVLLDFTAKWCGPCKLMDRRTFPDKQVTKELKEYVRIRIDRDQYPELARTLEVNALPTYIVMDEQGRILKKSSGYQIAIDFAEWLAAARQ